MSSSVEECASIEVKPYTWEIEDKCEETDMTQIRAWCLDGDSRPVLLRINFPIFCFMELPMFCRNNYINWTVSNVEDLIDSLKSKLHEDNHPFPFRTDHIRRFKKLFFFKGDRRYLMVYLRFKTQSAMCKAASVLEKPIEVRDVGWVQVHVHEVHIVDVIRKLLTKCRITHTSWITALGERVPEGCRISFLEREYIVDWKTIKRSSRTDVTHPGILSIDIEQYCDNHRMFPDKWNPKHVAYLVSLIYERDGSDKSFEYAVLLGRRDLIPNTKIENAMLFVVETEEELVRMMCAIIRFHDPEIITGYNILNYDFSCLNARLEILFNKWPVVGRLKDVRSTLKSDSWQSLGYGFNTFNKLIMPGRVTIDLLNVMKRGNIRFNFYDLDTVSKYYLGRTKHPIKAVEMFKFYEDMRRGNIEGMLKTIAYCIQDSRLVMELFKKLYMWIELNEMSSIVGVDMYDLNTRGQQIRCIAQVYDLAANSGIVIDSQPPLEIYFEGGFVKDPMKGFHKIAIFIDFNSLYPSIMIANNISIETYVPEEMDDKVPDELCNVIYIDTRDTDFDIVEDKEKPDKPKPSERRRVHKLKFIKEPLGLIPQLAKNLKEARAKVKEEIKREKDPIRLTVLDKQQNGIKVSNNSLYGFIGASNGRMSCKPAAAAVTAWGRKYIQTVNEYLKSKYNATIVYGDTDSSVVVFPQITDRSQAHSWGKTIASEVSTLFPEAVNIEFEKAVDIVCIKKKMYAGLYIEPDGSYKMKGGKKEILARGIHIARRDNCEWSRTFYERVLRLVLDETPLLQVLDTVCDEVEAMLAGKVIFNRLIIIRGVKTYPADSTYFMKVFADRLRDVGKPVQPGERLQYLVVDNGGRLLGERMVLPEMYEESLMTEQPLKIDYRYYIEKVVGSQIDSLIDAAYSKEIAELGLVFTPCRKEYGLDTFVQMLIEMTSRGNTIQGIRSTVHRAFDEMDSITIDV